MKSSSCLFLPFSAALLWAVPALAADYDPPILIEEAPEYVPVEIGSGWYLRGDISYNFGDGITDFELFDEQTEHRRFGVGVGVGYHFNDFLRGDVTVSYLGGDRYSYNDGTDRVRASHSFWSGLVNGYADLGTIVGITPYIGGGIGIAYSSQEFEFDSPTLGRHDDFSESQYSFAYALNAGASYRVTDNVSVDLGYQFFHAPEARYLDFDAGEMETGAQLHQVKLGLRYDLW